MSQPGFSIDIHDLSRATTARATTAVGERFVFLSGSTPARPSGRLARLLGLGRSPDATRRVLPLLGEAVTLSGMSIRGPALEPEPLLALITDRDLYRAEQDTVNVFLAMPVPRPGMRLIVEHAGQIFSERPLQLEELGVLREHGLHLEPLAMLLPGDYTVQLALGEQRLGRRASFTVAEYTLAPLSGRLLAHSLDRASQQLAFSLEVDSYQQPFDRALQVEIVEAGITLASIELQPVARGRYEGQLPVSGEGLLRLRLSASDDAERVCEVVIPGSRRAERDTTLLSELGTERMISLMPEPGALPLRGAWLSDGDFLATPLVVEQLVATEGVLSVRSSVEALTTITVDLATGEQQVQEHGAVAAGDEIKLRLPSCATTVFVGGWVRGVPFEAFTHFLRPAQLGLEVSASHDPRRGTLRVQLQGVTPGTPVLLSVRDERLTQADTPAVALSGALKRSITSITEGYRGDRGVLQLADDQLWNQLIPQPPPAPMLDLMEPVPMRSRAQPRPPVSCSSAPAPELDGLDELESDSPLRLEDEITSATEHASDVSVERSLDERPPARASLQRSTPPAPGSSRLLGLDQGALSGLDQASEQEIADAPGPQPPDPEPAAPRAIFPEVLFYDLVEIDGQTLIEIPVADVLGTFAVEAFCVDRLDWAHERATVIIDRPVRADLGVPPAVYDGDQIVGTLRGAATGGSVRLSLTCDGQPVPLRDRQGDPIDADEVLPSPAEVRF
ncbi:MAG TPA: hypothetical protein ENK18_14565, partial [Deltaproteobacteria bacterium]|nr:hypothetical protein [Deltaproteobacteria bacterium]